MVGIFDVTSECEDRMYERSWGEVYYVDDRTYDKVQSSYTRDDGRLNRDERLRLVLTWYEVRGDGHELCFDNRTTELRVTF